LTSLASESTAGSTRSAAARTAAVALVAALHAARALKALPATADPEMMAAPSAWTTQAYLRRDAEVQEALTALQASTRPRRAWHTPLYRSHRIAAASGLRATVCLAPASAFFVLAGWPATDIALSLVGIIISLGATTPNPIGFTVVSCIGAPIAAVLAGILEFLILDGATEFPLLALALAPFMIGSAVLMVGSNQLLSSLGRLNLLYILILLGPSNPQLYNAETFLFTVLFICGATVLLLGAQILVPMESSERRRRWFMASARRDFAHLLSRHDRRLAPEEAIFRDATRIGQIPAGGANPRDSAVLVEALSYFDRAAAIRLCRASLARLADTSLSHLAAEALKALAAQDTQRLRDVGLTLKNVAGAESALAEEISGELAVAAMVIDAAIHTAPSAMEAQS
jgi:hypothetical protein